MSIRVGHVHKVLLSVCVCDMVGYGMGESGWECGCASAGALWRACLRPRIETVFVAFKKFVAFKNMFLLQKNVSGHCAFCVISKA